MQYFRPPALHASSDLPDLEFVVQFWCSYVQFSSVQSVKVGIRNNLQFKSRSVIKMMLVLTIFTCHTVAPLSATVCIKEKTPREFR